jgi:nucleotide-binding universal stress UspA family protein
MYDQILFPTDGSDGARIAFGHALDIAAAHDGTVRILNVADTTQISATRIQGQVVDALEQEGQRIVSEAEDRAERRDVTSLTEVIQGEPYSTIVRYADAQDIDLVVMPTHGREGLEQYLLGSTTERVVRRSNVPVLTVPFEPDSTVEYPYRDLLVPTDGSGCAERALSMGVDIANMEGAALHLVSVISHSMLGVDRGDTSRTTRLEERADELIEEAKAFAGEAGIGAVFGSVEEGSSVSQAILSYIDEQDIDLVVMGTHGRTGFDRYALGSVTEKLVRTAPVPVLTVRTSEEDQ